MSILGHSAQTIFNAYLAIGFIVAIGVSAAVGVVLGVHRPQNVVGPERLGSGRLSFQFAIAMLMGFCSMLLVSAQYTSSKGFGAARPGHPQVTPTPGDWAFLATVPPMAYFATLLIADWAIGGIELLRQLGLSFRRIPAGIVSGLLAAMVILPPTYVLTYVAAWICRWLQYRHPGEHDLLRAMHEAESPRIQWTLILAAVAVAPLFEEFLFRGHLQTLIRRVFVALASPYRPGRVQPDLPPGGYSVIPSATTGTLPLDEARPNPPVWQIWAAIFVTSVLFALVHPLWMAPPIFFLSLGLGYCYERTGNLWASITVHSLFNSVSTYLYLHL